MLTSDTRDAAACVKEALDLCLSCKGCRSDCPTHTDMAAFKAVFEQVKAGAGA